MELTYEQRKQAALEKKEREETEVRQLFPQVVKQVAAAMGYTPRFHYKTSGGGKGEPFSPCHAVIENGTRGISLRTSDYSPDFRLSISGEYDMGPSEVSVSWPYNTPRPGIAVSMRRDAAAIAKEIKTRFLPDYDAACAQIAERVKQATDHRNAIRSNTDRLAAIAGVEVRNVHGSKELQTEFFKYYGADYSGPKLEVKASSDGATIEFSCGMELAAAIVKAIDTLAGNKTKPDTRPACTTCGHSAADHEDDDSNECWNGSGFGNRCACREYDGTNEAGHGE